MLIGSLFAGIGGLELGLEQSGLGHTVWQVEQNPYCLAVLKKHWPNVERYTDVKEVGSHNLASVDLICGGFPCQDVSSAGKGAGIAVGTRSGLWFEFRRIIGELRPRFVVVENVASGARRWLPTVRRDLHLLGYDSKALGISARDVGAPHLRKRIFVIAHPYRTGLWVQPGWCRGTVGRSPTQSAIDGDQESMAHANGNGELQSEGSVEELRGCVGDGGQQEFMAYTAGIGERESTVQAEPFTACGYTRKELSGRSWWAVEPGIRRVAHGIPARVDRLKSLGNAVVPQCAEIVGKVILDML